MILTPTTSTFISQFPEESSTSTAISINKKTNGISNFHCSNKLLEPSRPPSSVQARSTSPTSIYVLWKQIPQDFINGILLGYLVICTSNGLRNTSKTVSANSTYLEFTGLQRHTLYSIHVLGYTAAGKSPASKTVYVKTQMEGRFHNLISSFYFLSGERRKGDSVEIVYNYFCA